MSRFFKSAAFPILIVVVLAFFAQKLISPGTPTRDTSFADFETQLASAWRVVGVYERAGGRTVGFARAVSDGVALAYLADLYVSAEVRGNGLGRLLVREMIDNGPGARFRWLLHTRDAHGLYERFGFTKPDETYLERPASLG